MLGLGLSEAAPVVPLLDPASAMTKVGSAGRPALMVDVRVDADEGRDAEPGRPGELWVRGPNVMAGYWRNPEAARQASTADGWLRTGDAGRIDGDGFVWIIDRLRDGFTTEGGVVYPGDVERVLLEHPAVDTVGVGGVRQPSERGSAGDCEAGIAFIVLSAGHDMSADENLAFARQRVRVHEVPTAIVFVERLPRTTVGKLQRDAMRDAWSQSSTGPDSDA